MSIENLGDFFVPTDNTALIVIDFQEKLVPAINNNDKVVAEARRAIEIASVLGIPVIVTEQVPEKIGATISEIKEVINPAEVIHKKTFSCFGEPAFLDILDKYEVDSLVVCGIEAHVCVLQTVLDALSDEYGVYLLANAIGSRKDTDRDFAIQRASNIGADIITVEMMAFEWMKSADHKDFKTISRLVR